MYKSYELQYNKKTHHKLMQWERIDFDYVMYRIIKDNNLFLENKKPMLYNNMG